MFVYFYKRGSIIFNSSLFLNKTIYFLFLFRYSINYSY